MVHHSGQHRQPGSRLDEGATSGTDLVWEGWQHPRGRRPLRLIAALGTIAGGLCVVLAMMGVVVEFGPGRSGSPSLPVGRTVHVYRGPGARRPALIRVPRTGEYGVAWKFTCRPGQSGAFIMKDRPDPRATRAEVSASGTSGKGTWWKRRGRLVRSLYVVADCRWNARVVRPARTGTPALTPGRGVGRKPKHKPHGDHGQGNHGQGNQGQGNQGQGNGNHGQGNQGNGNGNHGQGNQG